MIVTLPWGNKLDRIPSLTPPTTRQIHRPDAGRTHYAAAQKINTVMFNIATVKRLSNKPGHTLRLSEGVLKPRKVNMPR